MRIFVTFIFLGISACGLKARATCATVGGQYHQECQIAEFKRLLERRYWCVEKYFLHC